MEEYLPWLGATSIKFENLTPHDALKMYIRRFFALNEQSK